MINLQESIGPGRDRTRNPWICSQTPVGLIISEDFLKVFPNFKSIEANDSMASIDTRSTDGRIYVGDHKT